MLLLPGWAAPVAVMGERTVMSKKSGTPEWIWRPGAIRSIHRKSSVSSGTWVVATDGSVVVGRGTAAAGPRAFIWKPGEGMRSLREVFEEISGTDLGTWKLEEATAISHDGRVVAGNGRNPDNQPEAWVLTLPEPTAIDLQCAVLLALAGLARARQPGSHSRAGSPASGNELARMGSRIHPSEPRSSS